MNKHRQRSEETKKHIMDAAEICFAQGGYDGTSVSQICQQAGVSKGAFYHHFDSKQQLFLALLSGWLGTMDGQLVDLRKESDAAPERLLAMTGIIGRLLQVPNSQLLIYLEFLNKAARDQQLWEMTIQPYHQYLAAISALVAKGSREGSLRTVDPQTAASMVIALALGLLIQGFLDPDGAEWDQVAQKSMGLLIDGLRSTPDGDE